MIIQNLFYHQRLLQLEDKENNMKVFLVKALRHIILSLFTALLFAGVLFSANLISPKTVSAATCRYLGQCVNNAKCVCPPGMDYYQCRYQPGAMTPTGAECGSAIIGGVEPPTAIAAINTESGQEIGLIFFVSRALNFANIVAGILVMINFVAAGFSYVTSAGNSGNMAKINEKLMWSLIGILMIVASYTLAAIFGLVFYGDPTFIITPVLTGAIE